MTSYYSTHTKSGSGSGSYTATGVVLDDLILTIYSKDIQFLAQPNCKFDQFADVKTELGGNPGDKITFFKYNNLAAGGKLTEGVDVETEALGGSTVDITVDEYGKATSVTEMLLQTSFDNIMGSAAKLLAMNYTTTLDTTARDCLVDGAANEIFADDSANVDAIGSTDYLTLEEVKDAVEVLATLMVPKIGGDHYVMFVDPHQSRGLRDDPNWIAVGKLDPVRLYNGQIGRIEDVIFIETTQVEISHNTVATPIHIHTGIMLGENAFGKAVVLPVEMRDNGVEDFGRKRSLMWYSIFGYGVLNEDNYCLIHTA
jgi:N4-gp56 family major capsid protein